MLLAIPAAEVGLEADDEHRGLGSGGEGEDDERGALGRRENEQVRRHDPSESTRPDFVNGLLRARNRTPP